MTRERRVLFRRKMKLTKKLTSNRTEEQKARIVLEIQQIDHDIIQSHQNEIRIKENYAVNKVKNDSKYFFNYAKSKSVNRCPVGPLKGHNKLVTNPIKMSEMLKCQFEAVFSKPLNSANIEELLEDPGPRCLEDIEISEEDIAEAIKTIPLHSAPGPDGIPA